MAKKGFMLFKLLSSAGTGFFYVSSKSTAKAATKLSLIKFDPLVNSHVLFNEVKLKKKR